MPMGLGLKQCVFLLAIFSISQGGLMVEREGSSSSMERELQVERKLKLLNKPAVKSIQSEDGDIIDCVDIHKQPAFNHPLLKNHTIQMKPPHDSFHNIAEGAYPPASSSPGREAKPLLLSSQLWLRSGSCPEGTIPIRRVQRHHLLNAPSIKSYGKKSTTGKEKYEFSLLNKTLGFGIEAMHSMGVLVAGGYSYTGAKANINVWNPHVAANDEYTSGFVSLRNGVYNNSDEIEFGWTVNPTVYGDKRARLFIYWTTDSGKSTGCYDLLCSGFVQTSGKVALGTIIDPVSQLNGDQYYIDLYVWKDYSTDSGSWWLVYNNTTTIGYWPFSIFNHMYVSTMVLFGGDVYSPRMRQAPHTETAMGSGRFANDHWGYAAFIGKPRIRDFSLTLKYPDPSHAISPQVDCYSAENFADQLFAEPLFYFGGPGRNRFCP